MAGTGSINPALRRIGSAPPPPVSLPPNIPLAIFTLNSLLAAMLASRVDEALAFVRRPEAMRARAGALMARIRAVPGAPADADVCPRIAQGGNWETAPGKMGPP